MTVSVPCVWRPFLARFGVNATSVDPGDGKGQNLPGLPYEADVFL